MSIHFPFATEVNPSTQTKIEELAELTAQKGLRKVEADTRTAPLPCEIVPDVMKAQAEILREVTALDRAAAAQRPLRAAERERQAGVAQGSELLRGSVGL